LDEQEQMSIVSERVWLLPGRFSRLGSSHERLGSGAAILNPEQITYPPLDTLKPVTKDVWIVDSGPMTAMGFVPLPIRMTVVHLNNGSLLLHSPTLYR
jgi:hypothetical protein